MGQKVNPIGFRVGPSLIKGWASVFYAERNYADYLVKDIALRRFVMKECAAASVSRVIIERTASKGAVVNIHAKRPGAIIGKSGSDIEKLRGKLSKIAGSEVFVNIHEIRKPDLEAQVLAQGIASQLEKRVSFRKAMKRAMQVCMKSGGKGVKVSVSGRLAGAEIARTEWYREGRVPLHTLRADIDYALAEAITTYGVLGVKVWVYRGDISDKK